MQTMMKYQCGISSGFSLFAKYPFMERAIQICYVNLLYTFYLTYYLSDLFEEHAKQVMNIPLF